MSPEARLKDFVAAFGQQGARAAAIFTDPAVMKNLLALTEGLKSAKSPEELRRQYGQSPLVQFHQAEETFMTALMKLGETVLPAVNVGLMGLTGMLMKISDVLGWAKANPGSAAASTAGPTDGIGTRARARSTRRGR